MNIRNDIASNLAEIQALLNIDVASKKNKKDNSITPEDLSPNMLSILSILLKSYQIVLTGAPGTGKTFSAKRIAYAMTGDTEENHPHVSFCQFHPSFDYTDFVEGLRPTKPTENGQIGFSRQDGIFKKFCSAAAKNYEENTDQKYVFIIDEINRGDISKIFGELFYAIDPGYRGKSGKIVTQYANLITEKDDPFYEGFYIPENLYIIGTMNDIDRSVESMDFAIRRRFSWVEVSPDDATGMWKDTIPEYQEEAKIRMLRLNKKISELDALGESYCIGPAYFLKLKEYKGDFAMIWSLHILPLIKEYLRGSSGVASQINVLRDAFFEPISASVEGTK